MKQFKKITALLVLTMLVLTSFTFPTAAASSDNYVAAHWKFQNEEGCYTGSIEDDSLRFIDLSGNGNDLEVCFEGNGDKLDIFEWDEGATVGELHKYEWAVIPHFYNAFYVYQYATGFSSAVAIASRIFETGDAADYIKFLSTGGSDYPLEELKIAGVDLTKPDTVQNAMKVFADALDEFEQLLKEIK